MDPISIVGIVVGLTAIIGGQVLEGGHVNALVQPTAFLIVEGGTLGAVLVQSPGRVIRKALGLVKWAFFPPQVDPKGLIQQVIHWSQLARKEGLLALENQTQSVKDPFLRKGLQLLVDGAEPERLREVMEVEIATYEEEHKMAAKVWESAGGYSPTIGIIGAVLGLIHVMENLSDPSKLGAGIAVAFVATIYGLVTANLICLPLSKKLLIHTGRLVTQREMFLDGLLGIANGDNPRIIESRLQGYFSEE